MPNYQNGKIYCIRSPNTEQVYIGSTVDRLSRRITKHRSKANTTRSKLIFEAGDAYIELIEEFPCNNKEQLSKREGEIIRATPNCCNCQIAGRTNAEYQKQYREANKEANKEYQTKYRQSNKDKIAEYNKTYRAKIKAMCSSPTE